MHEVAAVLFDADGVLQHAAHDWVVALDDLGGPGFASVVFAHELPAMRGEATMRGCLEAAAAVTGVDLDVTRALELWSRFDVDADALAVVTEVRDAGCDAYLATNQQDVRRDIMRRRYAGVFDDEFYSCELGACKPSVEFFVGILERLGLAESEIVFVDDSQRNVEAAASCGIRAYLHDPGAGASGLRRLLGDTGL